MQGSSEHTNSYYAATTNRQTDYPVLAGEHRCDVAVVGAGFTGLSTAVHLAERGYDVAVVEAGGEAKEITHLNRDLLDHRKLGRVEEIRYKSSFDKREIQGWIVTPADFDPSKKYPLVLEIHGGPVNNYGDRFTLEIQLYAAKGYVIFYANPRGSTSYGREFGNLIHHNYPGEDYDDLISGVDALIARGFIDDKRLYVTGGSAGGIPS